MNKTKNTLFTDTPVTLDEKSYIMAIESSCDETACAIVKGGRKVVANVVASQIKTHEQYGGVIPEIAAREHLEAINVVIDKTFKEAFMNAAIELLEGDSSLMEEVLEENSVILALEDLAFKEFVGKTLVADKDLFDNKKAILEAIEEIISESEYLSESKMLFEEDEGGEEETDASLETSDKDIDALKDALDKALDKITDEKLVSKINALKDALDTSKDSGATDVGTVKECVELLSF